MSSAAFWLMLQPLQPLPKPGVPAEDGRARERGDITEEEDPDSRQRLAELYAELHSQAEHLMRGQPNGTLQPTALVNEACLKLFGNDALVHGDRGHLLALGARAMRCVLVDHARAKARLKRQAPGERVPLDGLSVAFEARAVDLLALHEALERLAAFDAQMARAVELHLFGGQAQEEIACALDIPLRTFERRWQAARAWLRAELR